MRLPVPEGTAAPNQPENKKGSRQSQQGNKGGFLCRIATSAGEHGLGWGQTRLGRATTPVRLMWTRSGKSRAQRIIPTGANRIKVGEVCLGSINWNLGVGEAWEGNSGLIPLGLPLPQEDIKLR